MVSISKHDIYRLAGEAQCDPRTVRAYVEGTRSPLPLVKQGIDRALSKLGLAKPRAAREVRA